MFAVDPSSYWLFLWWTADPLIDTDHNAVAVSPAIVTPVMLEID